MQNQDVWEQSNQQMVVNSDTSKLHNLRDEGPLNDSRVEKILQRREQRIQQQMRKEKNLPLQPLQPSPQRNNMVGNTPKGDPKQWLKLLKKKRVR